MTIFLIWTLICLGSVILFIVITTILIEKGVFEDEEIKLVMYVLSCFPLFNALVYLLIIICVLLYYFIIWVINTTKSMINSDNGTIKF